MKYKIEIEYSTYDSYKTENGKYRFLESEDYKDLVWSNLSIAEENLSILEEFYAAYLEEKYDGFKATGIEADWAVYKMNHLKNKVIDYDNVYLKDDSGAKFKYTVFFTHWGTSFDGAAIIKAEPKLKQIGSYNKH